MQEVVRYRILKIYYLQIQYFIEISRRIYVDENGYRGYLIILHQYELGYAELNQKLEAFMIDTNMQFNEIYQALTELASKIYSV